MLEQIKEKMINLWGTIKENKETVIRVGAGIAGALIGAVVTAALLNGEEVQEDYILEELDAVDGEDETETSE